MKKFFNMGTVAVIIKVLGLVSMALIALEFLGFIAPLPKAAFIPTPMQLGAAFLASAILGCMPLTTIQKWIGMKVEKEIKKD